MVGQSSSVTPECDCLAHRFGNAGDNGTRRRCYPSDMMDEEWAAVRPLLPVPGWLRCRGGQPEAYCHRAILDAVRYLVDNGIKWRAMPADFLQVTWNLVSQDASRILRRSRVLRRSVGQRGGAGGEVAGPGSA
ncbi:transposase [Streptomyces sp. V4-01]|uniref:Transposase n=1 Tax=Actinacidiphila polyblastidii TaxID=3110430 RepID=A0ABU7PCS6_9ACTN|nr:transposase [Streptomyces sp. V4-01]